MQTFTAELFKKATAPSANIKDRVKTFEDACEVLGIFPASISLTINADANDDLKAITAFAKLQIICRALNEGWKPDWTDSSQYKYYPWFKMSSGSGLAFNGCVDWHSYSGVGSRLCFKSRELAEYAGNQFIDIYTDFFIIK